VHKKKSTSKLAGVGGEEEQAHLVCVMVNKKYKLRDQDKCTAENNEVRGSKPLNKCS
jgi:hypothetical protein